MITLTKEDVKALCAPFDEKTLGVKVQSTSKDKTKAMLVCYLQHTDVAARLDEVDTAWSCAITDSGQIGQYYNVKMRITVKGVSREGVGEGDDPKSAASDALKRTAMLFGVGRYLYDSETVWVPYNETTDRFKQFTFADYKAVMRPGMMNPAAGSTLPQGAPAAPKPAVVAPLNRGTGASVSSASTMSRPKLGEAIDQLSNEIGLSEADQASWIQELYKKPLNRLTLAEMIDFHGVLEGEKVQKQERFK